ncbi:MAG TPA: hypothetical protein VGE94_05930 [Chloroflexota bacterium]
MQHAKRIGRHVVTRWGMSERLGPITLAQRSDGFLDPAEGDATIGTAWRPYREDTALRPAPHRGVLQLPVRGGRVRPRCEHLAKGGS